MEATKRGNYSAASCSDTSEFEGALHSLGTAVAEENMCEPFRREMRKTFKEASTHVIVDNLGAGDKALRLLRDSSSNLWPSMPNVRYAMARGAVDVGNKPRRRATIRSANPRRSDASGKSERSTAPRAENDRESRRSRPSLS